MSKSISVKKREIIYKKYNGKCAYCGVEINIDKMHIDHITPKYRGWSNNELIKYNKTKGKDNYENLNPSCASCNCSKSTFTVEDWKKQIILKIDRIKRDSSTFNILERFGLIEIKKREFNFYFEKIEGGKNG